MDKKKPWGGYLWPVMTVLLLIPPLYIFRDEESTLHTVFRVVWVLLLVLSLGEIGRALYRNVRGRPVSPAPSGRAPGDDL
jgi:hypothetical protein